MNVLCLGGNASFSTLNIDKITRGEEGRIANVQNRDDAFDWKREINISLFSLHVSIDNKLNI